MCYYNAKELHEARGAFAKYKNRVESDPNYDSNSNRVGAANHFIKKIEERLFFKDELPDN